jgi:hypothetical protein
MTHHRFAVYPSRLAATNIARVINARLGLPRRDRSGGPESAAMFERARGWTTNECSILDAQDGSGEACLVLTAAALALSGQPGPPSLDFSGALLALPAKFVSEV